MLTFILQAAFYLGMAVAATRISWRNSLGLVGLTLILCSAITTAACYGGSLASRLVLECVQAVVIINSSRIAFAARPGPAPIAIVTLSIVDLAFCAALGFKVTHGPFMETVFGGFTNAIFALQCVAVAAPGVRDARLARYRDRAAGGVVGRPHSRLDALMDEVRKL